MASREVLEGCVFAESGDPTIIMIYLGGVAHVAVPIIRCAEGFVLAAPDGAVALQVERILLFANPGIMDRRPGSGLPISVVAISTCCWWPSART